MKVTHPIRRLLISCASCASLTVVAEGAPKNHVPAPAAVAKPTTFTVYDNMGNTGKPDTRAAGLAPCLVVYIDGGNHGGGPNAAPDEKQYKELIGKYARSKYAIWMNPKETNIPLFDANQALGPIILDYEGPRLSGPRETVEKNFRTFMNLVKWTHEAAPGRPVGYYGHGLFPEAVGKEYAAEAKELAHSVDAFFPSMYTFNDNRAGWKNQLDGLLREAHQIAPGKPVYPYLWAHYHGAPEMLPADYVKFQLDAAKAGGANGVVFWSGRNPWDNSTNWWEEVVKFVAKR